MRQKILIVDDEESILESLSDILLDEGYRVVTAASAEEGLKALTEENPDLLILDVWLPDTDGLEVLKKLRKEAPELPVIVISGHGTVEMAVQAIKLGAFDFLEKPFSLYKAKLTLKRP